MKTAVSLVWAIFIVLLLLGSSVAVKIYINAGDEFQIAEELLASGNPVKAVVHFERSIRWYLPGSSLKNKAARRIWETAEKFESAGDSENAINSYRLLRGGFYATRSFYTPGKEWIKRCNEKIATLMAQKPAVTEADKTRSFDDRKAEYLKILSAEKSPYASWAILCEIGFLGWVTCAVLFIFRGFGKSGQFKPRQAIYWAGGFIVFYGFWVIGMYKL